MSAHNHRFLGAALVDVLPAFRERMAEFTALAETDPAKAAMIFSEAQGIAKVFWAGVQHGHGGDN